MILEATPFLSFGGDCGQAIELYKAALGAEVVDRRPWDPAMFEGGVPDAMKEGVMYARLMIGKVPLEMSDVPPPVSIQRGLNVSINVHLDDPGELDRCYAALAEGGEPQMPPENMFWGARYGELTDRFGIRWTLHCQLEGGA